MDGQKTPLHPTICSQRKKRKHLFYSNTQTHSKIFIKQNFLQVPDIPPNAYIAEPGKLLEELSLYGLLCLAECKAYPDHGPP